MADSPAATERPRSSAAPAPCVLATVGAIGARRILKSQMNGQMAAIPATTIPVLEKLGITVRDEAEDYVL